MPAWLIWISWMALRVAVFVVNALLNSKLTRRPEREGFLKKLRDRLNEIDESRR